MERIRSRIVLALGGAVRVRGGGLLALAAIGLLAGVGCTGSQALRMKDVLPSGWIPSEPVAQIVCAFNPQIQHLPDPSPGKEGTMGAGLFGQLYLIASSGKFTDANGDLYVMAEDVTVRTPGQSAALTEIWHFDSATLRKLRSRDERFGECFNLFLPYPSNWKDVAQIRITTQYKPKGDPAKEPTLPGSPQTVVLDFTPPGEQPRVRVDKDERVTAPVVMKGMPNVARDLARGGWTTPLNEPQSNTTTVPTGGVPPAATNPVVPATGSSGGPLPPAGMAPLAPPPGATPPALANFPSLPPPTNFSPDRPQASILGPNGETLKVTGMALPPGQSMPVGWQQQPDGSIQPAKANTPSNPGLAPQQQQQPQQQWPSQQGSYTPPPNYVPASERYQSASQRNQSRIQHGAFDQPQAQNGLSGSLPALPPTAVPPQRQLPPIQNVPTGNVPPLPTGPSGVSGSSTPMQIPPAPAQGFDPNSTVGAWANQPPPVAPVPPPVSPVPPSVSGNPTLPTVPSLPPSNTEGPIVPILR